METLRSSAAAVAAKDDAESSKRKAMEADKEAEVAAGTEAREEISRLHKTIAELEGALKVNGGDGGGGDGGGSGGRWAGRGTDFIANGDEDGAEGGDGETAETTEEVIVERNRLRKELRQARKEAATRAAGLEMQLADKEVRVPPLARTPLYTRLTFVLNVMLLEILSRRL